MPGARYDRELTTALDACGYAAMRAPSSGSATERDLPDVLAGKASRAPVNTVLEALAIELKTTSDTTAYVDAEEVTALERFAADFGATAYLGVRFKRRNQRKAVWLVAPTDARMTDAGTFGLPEDTIEDRASMVVLPAGASTEPEVRTL